MADQSKPRKPTKNVSLKHWDPVTGAQEVPTITSLMNRKKLEKSDPYKNKTDEITLAERSLVGQETQFEGNELKTNAYSPRPVAPAPAAVKNVLSPERLGDRRVGRLPLGVWTPESLRLGKEPYEAALIALLPYGLLGALYLGADLRVSAQATKYSTLFVAAKAFGSRQQLAVWDGLRWDSQLFDGMWRDLCRAGWLELTPPSVGIPLPSANPKTFFRSAFGVDPAHVLTLVRLGDAKKISGLLVILSPTSVLEHLEPLIISLNLGKSGEAPKKSA